MYIFDGSYILCKALSWFIQQIGRIQSTTQTQYDIYTIYIYINIYNLIDTYIFIHIIRKVLAPILCRIMHLLCTTCTYSVSPYSLYGIFYAFLFVKKSWLPFTFIMVKSDEEASKLFPTSSTSTFKK